jgi:hypothetical protein
VLAPGIVPIDDSRLESIRRELSEGEQILWAERTACRPEFEGCTLRLGLPVIAGCSLVTLLCAVALSDPRFQAFGAFLGVLMVIFAIAGILTTVALIGSLWEYSARLRSPRWQMNVLTTQRIILRRPDLLDEKRTTHVITLYPSQIAWIARDEFPDGRGNVVFETIGGQGERSFPIKFENVSSPLAVEQLARQTLRPELPAQGARPNPGPNPPLSTPFPPEATP